MKKSKKIVQISLLFALFLLFPLWSHAAEVYNVIDYGAVADDGNSDGSAIQRALDQARGTSGMVTVVIPSGTYHLEKCLHIYSNTYLKLDANTTLYRMDQARNTNMLHAVDEYGRMDIKGGYEMCHDITIDGGIWDGGNVEDCGISSDVVRFDHGKNITVKNAAFKNVYNCHLLEFIGVKNGSILNCQFSDFHYDKRHKNEVAYGREAIQLDSAWTDNPKNLNDKSAYWAGGSVIDGTHNENILVSGCTFINYPTCVGQHHYSRSKKYSNSKNIVITNNTILADSRYTYFKNAIPITGMNQVTVSNNTIVGPYQYGVYVSHGKDISLMGNTIKNIRKNSIAVFSAQVTAIKNNAIASSHKSGIAVSASSVGSKRNAGSGIIGNTITGSRSNGISISGGSVSYISRNKISDTKHYGIRCFSGTVYAIRKNYVKKAKIGIFLSSGKRVKKKLSGNKMIKCRKKIKK